MIAKTEIAKTEIAKTDYSDVGHSAIDAAMMERCIHLSASAAKRGELPFAALICKGAEVIAETSNQVVQDADVTRHAELVAISQAQKILGRGQLEDCTLYTTVEPCAMCSFAVRENRISRVVFSIRSPMMGGLSKWNVLRDPELSHAMPEVFGPMPEVIGGISQSEAEKVWKTWNPVFWAVIKHRGYFGGEDVAADSEHARPERRSLLRRLFRLHRSRPA
jgi:tRNA(adenine34) deaminase